MTPAWALKKNHFGCHEGAQLGHCKKKQDFDVMKELSLVIDRKLKLWCHEGAQLGHHQKNKSIGGLKAQLGH